MQSDAMPRSTISFTAPRMDLQQVADEYNNLKPSEKERAQRDLYGNKHDDKKMRKDMDESNVAWLNELHSALQLLPEHTKISYNRALERCPDYVNDTDFLLMFLRADYFDVRKAAVRLCKYWKTKEQIFGRERAFRRTIMADLDEEDLVTLREGGYMPLPIRDQCGRAIMLVCRMKLTYTSSDQILRLAWYFIHFFLEDVTVQQNGLVHIAFDDGPFDASKYDRKLERILVSYTNEICPIRLVGVHQCFDSKVLELVLPFILSMLGPAIRARFRIHSCKGARLQELAEFGINAKCLPMIMGGTLDWDPNQWIDSRLQEGK